MPCAPGCVRSLSIIRYLAYMIVRLLTLVLDICLLDSSRQLFKSHLDGLAGSEFVRYRFVYSFEEYRATVRYHGKPAKNIVRAVAVDGLCIFIRFAATGREFWYTASIMFL